MYRKAIIGIVFGLAALVGVWDLLQVEAFDNAVVQFATAGVVPGTGVVLSTEQVYVVLACFLLVFICLLFRKGIMRDIRAIRSAMVTPEGLRNEAEETETPVVAAPVAAAAEPSAQAASGQPKPPTQPAPRAPRPIVIITIPRAPGFIRKSIAYVRPRIKPTAVTAWTMFKRRSRQDAVAVAAFSRKTAARSRVYAIRAWRYAEPRIRDYDARIERTLKRNDIIAQILHEADQFSKNAQSQIHDWRSKIQRTVEK